MIFNWCEFLSEYKELICLRRHSRQRIQKWSQSDPTQWFPITPVVVFVALVLTLKLFSLRKVQTKIGPVW